MEEERQGRISVARKLPTVCGVGVGLLLVSFCRQRARRGGAAGGGHQCGAQAAKGTSDTERVLAFVLWILGGCGGGGVG